MVKCNFYFVSRKQVELSIEYKDTIREVKRRLQVEEGIPEEIISLVYAKGVKSIKEAVQMELQIRNDTKNQVFVGEEVPPELIDAKVWQTLGRLVLEEDSRSIMSYGVEPDAKGLIHLFVIIEVIQEPYINLVKYGAPQNVILNIPE